MLTHPDAVLIDMRNHYEYEVGHFENALELGRIRFVNSAAKKRLKCREHADKR